MDETSRDFRVATSVAWFAEILRESTHVDGNSLPKAQALLETVQHPNADVVELKSLMALADKRQSSR